MSYLPIVHPDVSFSVARGLRGRKDDEYLEEQLDILYETNPAISLFIRKQAEKTDDPNGAMFCGLMVYKLLESQAECDYMNEQFKLD